MEKKNEIVNGSFFSQKRNSKRAFFKTHSQNFLREFGPGFFLSDSVFNFFGLSILLAEKVRFGSSFAFSGPSFEGVFTKDQNIFIIYSFL